ncbi:hypothetical protein SLS61_007282 [Didymella pomorum]
MLRDDGLRPGFDPERCYKESFAKEVSRIGRLLVNKGTEKMMPFEQYWAQYDEVPEVERFSHWEYTIEKRDAFPVVSRQSAASDGASEEKVSPGRDTH